MAGRAYVEAMADWSRVTTLDMNGDVSCTDESLNTTWTYVADPKSYCVDVSSAGSWLENVYVADSFYSEEPVRDNVSAGPETSYVDTY